MFCPFFRYQKYNILKPYPHDNQFFTKSMPKDFSVFFIPYTLISPPQFFVGFISYSSYKHTPIVLVLQSSNQSLVKGDLLLHPVC